MSLMSVDLKCFSCDSRYLDSVDRDEDTWKLRWDCKCCGGSDVRRIPSIPMTTRVSYVDGNDRFANLKRAAKLEIESMNHPREERAGFQQEIAALKKI